MSFQDMEGDSDAILEEMGFVPGAVSASAGWNQPLGVKFLWFFGGKRWKAAHDRHLQKLLRPQTGRKKRFKGDCCRLVGHDRTEGLV